MVANATDCIPASNQTAASSPDGMISVGGKLVHECVLASKTTRCNTACCVNPEVAPLRQSQEVRASIHRGSCLWACCLQLPAHPPACPPARLCDA